MIEVLPESVYAITVLPMNKEMGGQEAIASSPQTGRHHVNSCTVIHGHLLTRVSKKIGFLNNEVFIFLRKL